MALGEKLFEESGKIVSFKVTRVHPIEGTTTEVSYTSEVKGFGKFPSCRDVGSGIVTQYPHGVADSSHQGTLMMAEEGEQYMYWSHQKAKLADDGKRRGMIIASGFTNSQKLSWMNSLLMVRETESDPATQQFRITWYEWI
ncbi:MAG TPA: hypothetical protein VHJ59_04400 [Nitrososphaera sp.]|jgi:hypothetical protein|nr:hypothetical protein [Nitrososphaera sp.]